jgi:hypothetical protein
VGGKSSWIYVEPFWVNVEDNDGEYILHHEYFMLKQQYIHYSLSVLQNPTPPPQGKNKKIYIFM